MIPNETLAEVLANSPPELTRNMWLARWGSEPVTIERVYEDLALANAALVRDVAEYHPHNDTWTLRPHANN